MQGSQAAQSACVLMARGRSDWRSEWLTHRPCRKGRRTSPVCRDTSQLLPLPLPPPPLLPASSSLQAYPLLVTYRLTYCNQWVTQTLHGKAALKAMKGFRSGVMEHGCRYFHRICRTGECLEKSFRRGKTELIFKRGCFVLWDPGEILVVWQCHNEPNVTTRTQVCVCVCVCVCMCTF